MSLKSWKNNKLKSHVKRNISFISGTDSLNLYRVKFLSWLAVWVIRKRKQYNQLRINIYSKMVPPCFVEWIVDKVNRICELRGARFVKMWQTMEKDGLQCLLSFRGILNILVADTGEKGGEREREREYVCARRGAYVAINFNNTTIDSKGKDMQIFHFSIFFRFNAPGRFSPNSG